ncbi:MAG: glycosyltransferase family protein [Caulobacteraceae bacterium]
MVLAIVQARMSSSRLPGKVMRDILGEPMLGRQIERMRRATRLTRIVVATSTEPGDDVVANYAASIGVPVVRGALNDVLDRFRTALRAEGDPEHFIRITADCPLADPALIDRCIKRHLAGAYDYTHTGPGWSFPKGLDVEVVRTAVLDMAWREAEDPYEREHVTPFINRKPDRFDIGVETSARPMRWRWTVDTPEDFAFVEDVYAALYPANPAFTTEDILAWQDRHPDRALPHIPPGRVA